MSSARNRFHIHDRAKSQSTNLTSYNSISGERYWIIDRETGLPVAEASNQYAARQECKMWNDGIYKP